MDPELLAQDFVEKMIDKAGRELDGLPEELIETRRRHDVLLSSPVPFTLQRGEGREALVKKMKEVFRTVIVADSIGGMEIRFL